MATPLIPIRTPDGQAELGSRQRRVSQRHRTVLLLVDGRRSEEQVRTLAQQAGAPDSCFGDLLDLGMIMLPEPTLVLGEPMAADAALHVDIPIEAEASPPAADPPAAVALSSWSDDAPESLLPAARTLQPESVLNAGASESMLQDFEVLEAGRTEDPSLEEVRGMLMRAVRTEAPLTGSLTMLRLRRARTRQELAGLIDEVEARIIKPYRSLAAQQILRRARHLLIARVDSALPAG